MAACSIQHSVARVGSALVSPMRASVNRVNAEESGAAALVVASLSSSTVVPFARRSASRYLHALQWRMERSRL